MQWFATDTYHVHTATNLPKAMANIASLVLVVGHSSQEEWMLHCLSITPKIA